MANWSETDYGPSGAYVRGPDCAPPPPAPSLVMEVAKLAEVIHSLTGQMGINIKPIEQKVPLQQTNSEIASDLVHITGNLADMREEVAAAIKAIQEIRIVMKA